MKAVKGSLMVSFPKRPPLDLPLASSLTNSLELRLASLPISKQSEGIHCFRDREAKKGTSEKSKKAKEKNGHVFGHVGVDRDLDFPEPMPVVGISRSAKGYSLVSILETLKTFSVEDGFTEEALVTKLCTCRCHYLFLHTTLKNNISGTCRWGEFGEGGLLWAECSLRHFEWYEGDPVEELLLKVKELYGIDDLVAFRNIAVPSEDRPHPLHLGTATQIGAIPTEGIPCLLKVLLPSSCTGLPQLYVRDLLLKPPAYDIASTIQEICRRMSCVACSIPEFTCVSSAKLVKLLELREFNRIKNVADEILELHDNSELYEILKLLMYPTSVATGLKLDIDTLVHDCEWVSHKIGELMSLDGEAEQQIESDWKGHVKRKHMEEFYEKVEEAPEVLVFASMMLIIANALFAHVSEGRRRKWVFPTLMEFNDLTNGKLDDEPISMEITGLSPYWFDIAHGHAVCNTVSMKSLFLLTGPNGGGKSSLLRSVCAAALLGICGFMVPAESASIPHFDAIILHMKSYDSPVDGKSSFQMEMSEIRSLLSATTSRSLVLIDEICRGTETAKGTCIAGSIVETLDAIGCLGIVSTHLHGIFDLPLRTGKTVNKAMSAEFVDGQTIPTWKLVDGVCKESLAFETAQREGVPETLVKRAEELYHSIYAKEAQLIDVKSDCSGSNSNVNNASEVRDKNATSNMNKAGQIKISKNEVLNAVTSICQKKLIELYKMANSSQFPEINCIYIAAREQPPPSTIGASSVYVMLRPDKKLYVGETDDLQGRVQEHRSKAGLRNAAFISFVVQGKSVARQLETLLINQLPKHGFHLTNIADGKHRNFGTYDPILEPVTV